MTVTCKQISRVHIIIYYIYYYLLYYFIYYIYIHQNRYFLEIINKQKLQVLQRKDLKYKYKLYINIGFTIYYEKFKSFEISYT